MYRDKNIPRLDSELYWETSMLQLTDSIDKPNPANTLPMIRKYMLGETAIANHPTMFGTAANIIVLFGPKAVPHSPPTSPPQSWPMFIMLAKYLSIQK